MKYWPALLLFVVLAAWMFFAARTPTGEEDRFEILTLEQYQASLAKVRDLTQQPIIDFDAGKYLSKAQLDQLKEGSETIKKMIAFDPTNFGPYVMMAKSQRALGNAQEAVRNYKQALLLVPKEIKDQDTLWAAAEAHHDLAAYYYEEGDDKKAEEHAMQALMLVNQNPKYLITFAAIEAQLGKLKEARANLDAALKMDPQNPMGLELDAELRKAGS